MSTEVGKVLDLVYATAKKDLDLPKVYQSKESLYTSLAYKS